MDKKELVKNWKNILIKSKKYHHLIDKLDDPFFQDFILLHTESAQDYLKKSKRTMDNLIADYLGSITSLNTDELKEFFDKYYEPFFAKLEQKLKKDF